jgi:hypothetical protein
MVYCTLVGLWATTMTEFWKGRNAFLNLCWGMSDFKEVEVRVRPLHTLLSYTLSHTLPFAFKRERPEFIGVVRLSPVTDLKEMYHVSRSALYWRIAYSMSFLSILVIIACSATYFLLYMKNYLVTGPPCMAMGAAIAGGANAIMIGVGNEIYTLLAEFLTAWENHRTQSEYENQLVMKTFLFRFFNSYSSFFYIAFIKSTMEEMPLTPEGAILQCEAARCSEPAGWDAASKGVFTKCGGCLPNADGESDCMAELKGALSSIFITQIIVGNLAEVLVPILGFKVKTAVEKSKVVKMQKAAMKKIEKERKEAAEEAGEEYVKDEEGALMASARPEYEQPEKETKFDKYEDKEAFKEYAEMVIQYGFVSLFVSAFPLTPMLAMINNMLEIHVDAFKICVNRKRPKPYPADSTGMWAYFMAAQSTAAVVTNLALVCFTTKLLNDYELVTKLFIFVLFEHLLLLMKSLVQQLVPDTPEQVSLLSARQLHLTNKLFRGLVMEDDDDDKEEVAEEVDLEIHPNIFSLGKQVMVMNPLNKDNKKSGMLVGHATATKIVC